MQIFDPLATFLDPLSHAELDYMITGSFASIHYGEPRFTADIDLVVALDASRMKPWSTLYPDEYFYCPPDEVILIELARPTGGHFNIIHHETGFKADFYPSRSHPYWQWALENRQRVKIGEHLRWFAPSEYVILWKLEFYRMGNNSKHLRDIKGMMQIQGNEINTNLLTKAVAELNLETEWALIN